MGRVAFGVEAAQEGGHCALGQLGGSASRYPEPGHAASYEPEDGPTGQLQAAALPQPFPSGRTGSNVRLATALPLTREMAG